MPISATGPISFSEIQTEFGGSNPVSLSEYLTDSNPSYTSGISGIPSSGNLISISHFLGKVKIVELLYPPTGLSASAGSSTTYGSGQNITGQAYGNGIYKVRHSSKYTNVTDFGGWRLFQGSTLHFWGNSGTIAQPDAGNYYYNQSTGYANRSSFIAGYNGEFAILSLPVLISPVKFRLRNRDGAANPYDRSPLAFRIYGSSDNESTWTLIYANENNSPASGSFFTEGLFTFSSGIRYNYLGIIINRVRTNANSDISFNIGQLEILATDEAPSALLDNVTTTTRNAAAAIYGLKLYRSGYTGAIIRIRRSSDNQQQDFYANTAGNLTTAANGQGSSYATWLGAATGYVTVWYDQSANGVNAQQTDTTRQPILTTGLKVVFNGSSQFLDRSYSSAVNTSNFTYILRCTCYNADGNYQSPLTSRTGSPIAGYILYKDPSNILTHWNGGSTQWNTHNTNVTVVTNTNYKVSSQYNGATLTSSVNGTIANTNIGLTLNTSAPLRIGAGVSESTTGGFYWNGDITNVFYFNTSISTTDRDTILASL